MQVIVTNPELRKDISVTVTIGGSAPYYDRLNVNIDQKGNPNASHYYCLEMSAPNDMDTPEEPTNGKLTNKELETLLCWARAYSLEASCFEEYKNIRKKRIQSISDTNLQERYSSR